MSLPDNSVEEREIVAIRTEETGGHSHIVLVKLADGREQAVATVLAAIDAHEAHYVMRRPDLPLPLLVQARDCPDCAERTIFA